MRAASDGEARQAPRVDSMFKAVAPIARDLVRSSA
jgi:hypothetical protein